MDAEIGRVSNLKREGQDLADKVGADELEGWRKKVKDFEEFLKDGESKLPQARALEQEFAAVLEIMEAHKSEPKMEDLVEDLQTVEAVIKQGVPPWDIDSYRTNLVYIKADLTEAGFLSATLDQEE